MIKALLIDDEVGATELLKEQLHAHCPEVEVYGTCNDSTRAADMLTRIQPDLVFLDIEMPNLNGFELLQSLTEINFRVIFVTAYNQFALQAFRYAALDYLLKPIVKADLIQAVDRYKQFNAPVNRQQMEYLGEWLQNQKNTRQRIGLTVRDGVRFVEINSIIRCQAEGNYTRIFFSGSGAMLVSRTLGDFEDQLTVHGFIRISHSHLVQLAAIERYSREDGGYVVMKDGVHITVSKNKRESFLAMIRKI